MKCDTCNEKVENGTMTKGRLYCDRCYKKFKDSFTKTLKESGISHF